MRKAGKFFKWIDREGVEGTAKKYGLQRATVFRWRSCQRVPRLETVYRLMKLSRGAFSYADALSDTTKGKMK